MHLIHEPLDLRVIRWVNPDEAATIESAKGHRNEQDAEPQLSAHDVGEHFGVPRSVFRDYLKREVAESEACWSLPFTLSLVISYALFAILHLSALMVRSAEDSIEQEIRETARWSFVGDYMAHKTVDDVNSVADFWSWMSRGLVPMAFQQAPLFHEGYNESDPRYYEKMLEPFPRGVVLSGSQIVGGIRLQQERSGEGAEAQPCNTEPRLLDFYQLECVHGYGYELDPEMRSARYTTNPVMERWLYAYEDSVELQGKVWDLERKQWFDRHTRKVEIAIPVFNPNLGVHTLFYVNFFISRGGHMWKRTIPLSVVADWHPQWYYWLADATWLMCVLYIFASEVVEMLRIVKQSGVGGLATEYFGFWNTFDWVSLACALAVIIMFIVTMSMTAEANDKMAAIPTPPIGDEDPTAFKAAVKDYIQALETTVQTGHLLKLWLFSYPFIIIARLFKAYSVQPRLAVMTSTISRAGKDLVHFLIVVASVFLTFVVAGCILFGREVRSFGTFIRAVFACGRMILGDLMWDELRQVGVTEAAIWLVLFIVMVVMVLLNMLLAIIMDHYTVQKEAAFNRDTLWEEAAKAWRRWKLEGGLNCWRSDHMTFNVPISRVLDAILKEDRKQAEMKKAAAEEEEEVEDDDDDANQQLVKSEDVQKEYIAAWCPTESSAVRRLGEQQAKELIAEAVLEFHAKHAQHSDMEDVVYLTRKVDYRTKKIMKMAKEHSKSVSGYNEMEALRELTREFTLFTDELRSEREAHRKEAEKLRSIKRGLLLQLQLRMPDVDFSDLTGAPLDSEGNFSPAGAGIGDLHLDDDAPAWRLRNVPRAAGEAEPGASPVAHSDPMPAAAFSRLPNDADDRESPPWESRGLRGAVGETQQSSAGGAPPPARFASANDRSCLDSTMFHADDGSLEDQAPTPRSIQDGEDSLGEESLAQDGSYWLRSDMYRPSQIEGGQRAAQPHRAQTRGASKASAVDVFDDDELPPAAPFAHSQGAAKSSALHVFDDDEMPPAAPY